MEVTVNLGKMPFFQKISQRGLKSRKEKIERQQCRDNQIAVLEKQKANLKNMACGSLDEIEDKLKLLHSYEDQIMAVKHAYNNEQMRHILDEAREKGEKMAEEIKKHAPKTKEEMKKELREEALGIEDDQGMLSELMEELAEIEEEVTEKLVEEAAENITKEPVEEATEELAEDMAERQAESTAGQFVAEVPAQMAEESITEETSLVMHGKTAFQIDRYLDYYKRS